MLRIREPFFVKNLLRQSVFAGPFNFKLAGFHCIPIKEDPKGNDEEVMQKLFEKIEITHCELNKDEEIQLNIKDKGIQQKKILIKNLHMRIKLTDNVELINRLDPAMKDLAVFSKAKQFFVPCTKNQFDSFQRKDEDSENFNKCDPHENDSDCWSNIAQETSTLGPSLWKSAASCVPRLTKGFAWNNIGVLSTPLIHTWLVLLDSI
ncbi:hypothetical protein CAPTEDRAFT_192563 [Capitella teleta]|uniref:Uncharacterized protein n=1 Tax=Capitella teleta TaxID=283909 RepID=R7UCA2_CAPTE|nr:hypothetical protein CAPTEDRAFT_192563 [Capitella teleta]|eukprot:ELU00892.1 hypothetical protein CAPTEDRAFT_192563 [Capitella teleta]